MDNQVEKQSTAASMKTRTTAADAYQQNPPAWFDEFFTAQLYSDQILLCGNVRDLYPNVTTDGVQFLGLVETLMPLLRDRGVQAILIHDQKAGLHLAGRADLELEKSLQAAGLPMGHIASSLEDRNRVGAGDAIALRAALCSRT